MTRFRFNDGGRSVAGYKGHTRDCVVRALSIAAFGAGLPDSPAVGACYQQARQLVRQYAARERPGAKGKRSSLSGGVRRATLRRIMTDLGWRWRATMAIGGGCTTHLRADELPLGVLIVACSRHATTMIDGVIYDTHDPSREGTRCVYGFWYKGD